jgi:hypothetical protein
MLEAPSEPAEGDANRDANSRTLFTFNPPKENQ